MKKFCLGLMVISIFFVQGCSTYSQFTSVPDQAKIKIGKTKILGTAPVAGQISRTTFGQYPLKIQKEGYDVLYGVLPLHVSGGMIALDALLFAPAAFFNVQGSFALYKFDLEKQLIYYKNKEAEDWKEYMISDLDKNRAKAFFGD
jgi:hypothetical protein